MIRIDPKKISTPEMFGWLTSAIAPRPIALVSSIDQEGKVNLSPFSFFNVFSADPPILIFSPSRRVRDNTIKHTLENVLEVKEVVISVVNYDIVQQMSLSSTEYDKGVNEFVKAGFTEVKSDLVKVPRVGESPISFECKVNEIIHLGENGGAGNLVICEVLMMHVNESILNESGRIDQAKLDLVARLGANFYSRTNETSLFEVEKPISNMGIGIDQLPDVIKNSDWLTGNELGKLGNVESIPSVDIFNDANLENKKQSLDQAQKEIKELLANNQIEQAWIYLIRLFA